MQHKAFGVGFTVVFRPTALNSRDVKMNARCYNNTYSMVDDMLTCCVLRRPNIENCETSEQD